MSRTHFKALMNSEYLGAYSLEDGRDIVLTIDYIKVETVTGTDGKKEDLPVCHLQTELIRHLFYDDFRLFK